MRVILFFVTFTLLGIPVLLSQETSRFEVFVQISQETRLLWNALLDIPKENTVLREDQEVLPEEEAIQKVAAMAAKLGTNGEPSQRAVIRFFQTVTTVLLKKRGFDAEDCLIYADDGIVMGMEYFQMGARSAVMSRPDGGKLRSIILPIDGRQGESRYPSHGGYTLDDWGRSRDCPFGIPEVYGLFCELEDYDKAWRSRLEALYYNNELCFLDRKWISSRFMFSAEHAHCWHDVAECAYRAGERDLAWGFLMKAAVFGDEKLYATIIETAKLWIDVEAGKADLPKLVYEYPLLPGQMPRSKPKELTPEDHKKVIEEVDRRETIIARCKEILKKSTLAEYHTWIQEEIERREIEIAKLTAEVELLIPEERVRVSEEIERLEAEVAGAKVAATQYTPEEYREMLNGVLQAMKWQESEIYKLKESANLITSQGKKQRIAERIVRSYMGVNAHPRAWALIDEYWADFDEPERLKKEVQDDWLNLIQRLSSRATSPGARIIVYGYEVLRVERAEDGTVIEIRPHDPLDVKIPWIYPEGWHEAAQKMLDEEMKKLGVSPDRFRQWHTDSGAVSFVAKFVSFADNTVILEKEDGTRLTIAIDDFMLGDQNFIRHCFEKTSDTTKSSPNAKSETLAP